MVVAMFQYWPEVGNLTMTAIIALCAGYLHLRLQNEGKMGWEKVRWSTLSMQQKGKPDYWVATGRLFCAVVLGGEMLIDWDTLDWGSLSLVNEVVMAVYFAVAGLSSFLVLDDAESGQFILLRVTLWVMWILFELTLSTSLIAAIGFWGYLTPESCVINYNEGRCAWTVSLASLTQHIVCQLLILWEAARNRFFLPLEHQVFVAYEAVLVLLWQFSEAEFGGYIHYSFLDPRAPATVLLGLAALSLAMGCFQIARAWMSWIKPDCEAQLGELEALRP